MANDSQTRFDMNWSCLACKITLGLFDLYGKCSYIYHPWILLVTYTSNHKHTYTAKKQTPSIKDMICIENPPNKSHEINSYTTLLDIKPHLIKWNILQQVGRYYSIKYLQSKLSMVSVWQLHKFHFIISCSNFGGFYVLALCCPNQKKTEPNINPPLKSRSRRIPSSWLHPFPIAPGDRKKIPEKIACPVVVFREENPYHTIHVTDIFPYMNGWFCMGFHVR